MNHQKNIATVRLLLIAPLSLLVFFITVLPVQAQRRDGYGGWSDPMTGYGVDYLTALSNQQMQNVLQQNMMIAAIIDQKRAQTKIARAGDNGEPDSVSKARVARGEKVIAAGNATTRFTPSGQTKALDDFARMFIQQFKSELKNEADLESKLKKGLAQTLEVYKNMVAPASNLDTNDFSDSITAALAAKYETHFAGNNAKLLKNGTELSNSQLQALREFIRARVLKNAVLQGLDNGEREQLHQNLIAEMFLFVARVNAAQETGNTKWQSALHEEDNEDLNQLLDMSPDKIEIKETSVSIAN